MSSGGIHIVDPITIHTHSVYDISLQASKLHKIHTPPPLISQQAIHLQLTSNNTSSQIQPPSNVDYFSALKKYFFQGPSASDTSAFRGFVMKQLYTLKYVFPAETLKTIFSRLLTWSSHISDVLSDKAIVQSQDPKSSGLYTVKKSIISLGIEGKESLNLHRDLKNVRNYLSRTEGVKYHFTPINHQNNNVISKYFAKAFLAFQTNLQGALNLLLARRSGSNQRAILLNRYASTSPNSRIILPGKGNVQQRAIKEQPINFQARQVSNQVMNNQIYTNPVFLAYAGPIAAISNRKKSDFEEENEKLNQAIDNPLDYLIQKVHSVDSIEPTRTVRK